MPGDLHEVTLMRVSSTPTAARRNGGVSVEVRETLDMDGQ